MYAVVPEEGFLDDVIAVFKDEGLAELSRMSLEDGCSLVVVPVVGTFTLVEDTDS